jgi:CubicO group peptidase (beta-lactamase class C family)
MHRERSQTSLVPGYFADHGWGFGVTISERDSASERRGSFGWDGGLGSSWRVAPRENLVGVLLTQTAWTSPSMPAVTRDYWRAAYAALA